MTPRESYLKAVETFNSKGTFTICFPGDAVIDKVVPYTDEIYEKVNDLERYENIRKQGFSDDHLATEIGLFVLHLNQVTLNIKDNDLRGTG